jgi:hypothetical protein
MAGGKHRAKRKFLLALRREIYVASRNVRLDCTTKGDAGGNCGGVLGESLWLSIFDWTEDVVLEGS